MVYVRVLSSVNSVTLWRAGSNHPEIWEGVDKHEPDFLLNHGDTMQLTDTLYAVLEVDNYFAAPEGGLDVVEESEIKRFADRFIVQNRRLGAGAHASVFLAIKQSRRQVACKVVKGSILNLQRGFDPELFQNRKKREIAREVEILRKLDHPNVIRLEKVFCTSYNTYIFEELITGGDLMSYIARTD